MNRPAYTPAGYWDRRYRDGRTSGSGSEGDEGAYKAAYLSKLIAEHDVTTVVDWGCGDGQVLELIELPERARYTGVDVSPTIVARMRKRFSEPGYLFFTPETFAAAARTRADLAISMDVLFHLPDDGDYLGYLGQLFESASRYVVIYSTNYAGGFTARHVFRREFTPDIAERFPAWTLTAVETPLREGLASFFVYERNA